MDIVFDIETLDYEPTSVVLAIAATWFNYTDDFCNLQEVLTERSFYVKFDVKSQKRNGRTSNADTIKFWQSQPQELIKAIVMPSDDDMLLNEGLISFNKWLLEEAKLGKNDFAWSRGSHFDFPIIHNAYKQEALGNRISSWQVRDTRTYVMALSGDPKGQHVPSGLKNFSKHNPIDDAVKDAMSIIELTKKFYVG